MYISIFRDFTFSRCKFERNYVPCNVEGSKGLPTDVAIYQHDSTLRHADSVGQQSRMYSEQFFDHIFLCYALTDVYSRNKIND